MEIRIWDVGLSVANKESEMELVKIVDSTMYTDFDFGGFIVIDGNSYRQCMYSPKKEILCVEPVELNEQPEEIEYSDDFKCPFCNSVDYDAWELREDEGETYCGSCGSDLEYERVITVEYNIKPKKCAPVTRF